MWVGADPIADFIGAAETYRACRAGGITPRRLIDCIIAIRTGAELLAADQDFADMARILPLRLVRARTSGGRTSLPQTAAR